MASIFEATKYTPEQLKDLTKIALSLKYSYNDINDARTALGKQTILGDMLIKLASAVANSQTAFNAVTGAAKNESVEDLEEGVLTEENSAKLTNDIMSLKRIGWNLDRITKHLITSKEYGVKMTSDLIASIFSPPKAKASSAPMWPPVVSKKEPKVKKAKWPNHPPKSKVDDPQHAEAFIGQVFNTGEVQDMTGTEAYQILTQAGYTERATMWVIRNLGWEGDLRHGQGGTKIAKKTPKKRFEDFSNFNRPPMLEESVVKPLVGLSHEALLKLHYSKFPKENDPELKALSYVDRSSIMKAKDAVFAASKETIKADRVKNGKALFKKAGAKVGDFTSMGAVSKITSSGVVFNGGKEVAFDSLIIGGESVFSTIKKMSKDQYDASEKSRAAGHTASMISYTASSPRRLD